MATQQLATPRSTLLVPAAPESMSDRLRVGIFGNGPPWPPCISRLLAGSHWCRTDVLRWPLKSNGTGSGPAFDAAIIVGSRRAATSPTGFDSRAAAVDLLEYLRTHRIGTAWLGDTSLADPLDATGPLLLPDDVSDEQLHGAMTALSHVRPMVVSLDRQLADMQMLGEHLRRYFTDLEHDLSLAARLQRDFLPREMPVVGPLQFGTIYRPCNWVSGDMLDIFQIDRHRVAFYLIDAMGHGVAAALLTMFIRNAIRPRSAERGTAEWLAPGDVLSRLNEVLAAERLPDCHFLTGFYGVIDERTMELQYASAGHPAALQCNAEGVIEELGPTGALLGVFANQTFAVRKVNLCAGDRLLVFSDGLEDAFRQEPGPNTESSVSSALRGMPDTSALQLVQALAHQLDQLPGAFSARADDVSVIAMSVQSPV